MIIKGNILNVFTDEIYPGEIEINKGIIQSIKEVDKDYDNLILPGFIDAHIHIESSMLTPSRFAEIALKHGTTSIVADPHEIANVMGMEGLEYFIKDAKSSPLKYNFAAPSCVPATKYETNGACIDSVMIEHLLKKPEFVALGEVMDYTAVINEDEEILAKINAAHKLNKPVDGHAPLLSGIDLQKYVKHGITTDHECVSSREAEEKIRMGMKIMIREGSENKSLEDLIRVKADFLVSDDLKAEELINGHLDVLLRKAIDLGMDPFDAIKLVTVNPAQHYGLNTGCIAPGKSADLVFVDDLTNFKINRVIINGNTIFKKQKLLYKANPKLVKNTFNVTHKTAEDFDIKAASPHHKSANVNVIQVQENQILTHKAKAKLTIDEKGNIIPSVFEDILKISVVERYGGNTIANAFIKGVGIKNGALASSVMHDSHNIIVIGTNSDYMAKAVNKIIDNQGGFVAISNKEKLDLPLPIAGLMSDKPAKHVAQISAALNTLVHEMGCKLNNPFSTMSFMGLLVVPSLKISNKGLFDVEANKFIDVINYED